MKRGWRRPPFGILGWSVVLSVVVHAAFIGALTLNVSWRTTPAEPVQAEIWTRLPSVVAPAASVAAAPEPVAVPAPEPVAPPKPDIALKDSKLAKPNKLAKPESPKAVPKVRPEKVRPEKVKTGKAQTAKAEKNKSEPPKPDPRLEAQRQAQQREAARRALERALQEEMAADMAAEMAEDLDQVRAQRRQAERAARTAESLKAMAVRDAQERIRNKVRGLLRVPKDVKGNPEVVYSFKLFPSGELMGELQMLKSSGQPGYDREVERAILKAMPLPLPGNMQVAADFRAGLVLRFRPHDE